MVFQCHVNQLYGLSFMPGPLRLSSFLYTAFSWCTDTGFQRPCFHLAPESRLNSRISHNTAGTQITGYLIAVITIKRAMCSLRETAGCAGRLTGATGLFLNLSIFLMYSLSRDGNFPFLYSLHIFWVSEWWAILFASIFAHDVLHFTCQVVKDISSERRHTFVMLINVFRWYLQQSVSCWQSVAVFLICC